MNLTWEILKRINFIRQLNAQSFTQTVPKEFKTIASDLMQR